MAEEKDVVRLVAGPFHDIVVALWPGDQIGDYLLAPAARRQVWHAWLAAREEQALADPAAARQRLAFTSARDLLAEAYGQMPAGLAGALGRLGSIAQPPGVYADLATVLAEGDPGAKVLRHAKRIRAHTASLLAVLPRALRLKPIVDSCDIKRARYLAWLWRTAGAADRGLPADLAGKLSRGCPHDMLTILEEHLAPDAFPAPPFEARPPLAPVSSHAELRAAAKRFRNCLEHYAEEVIGGSRYFYLWEGEEPAVLAVTRIGAVGWRTGELAGLKNRKVSDGTRVAIAAALVDVATLFSEGVRPRGDEPILEYVRDD